jgi:RNA polymerase sigma-70 factor (sigma-E family)
VLDADEEIFRSFAATRLAPLRRLGYLICGDWHLAEDAVSTVLTKLYVKWDRLATVANLDAYVRTMLVRAIVDERRRPWRRESPASHAGPSSLPDPPATIDTDQPLDRLVLQSALARMPTRRRAVLVLRFFEGLSVEETAAAMGCSTGTVKSQTSRALAALREILSDDLVLDGGGS